MCVVDARLRGWSVLLLITAGAILMIPGSVNAMEPIRQAINPSTIHREGPTGNAVPLLSPQGKRSLPQRPSADEQPPEVFNDPVPPALWSGMSVFLLVGIIAGARRLRRALGKAGV